MKRSKSDLILGSNPNELNQPNIKYSMRNRIASRSLEIVCSGIMLIMLNRLDTFFLTLRKLGSTRVASDWINVISILAALVLVMYHYLPFVTRRWAMVQWHRMEAVVSLVFAVLMGCLTVAWIFAVTGNNEIPFCSPGKFEGRCDILNVVIVFAFVNTAAWGYSGVRSFSDSRKRGAANRVQSVSSLVRMNDRNFR